MRHIIITFFLALIASFGYGQLDVQRIGANEIYFVGNDNFEDSTEITFQIPGYTTGNIMVNIGGGKTVWKKVPDSIWLNGAGNLVVRIGETEIQYPISSSGNPNWGDVEGDINDQSDLITLFNGKAALDHSHELGDITGLADELDLLASITYVNTQIATRAPTTHNHDDLYFTEAEVTSLLATKQDAGSYAPASHNHNDIYYTETEVDALLATKQAAGSYATSSHTHDDRYYTETETDGLLANKVTVVSGKQLSTEDYTTTEKTKLAGIATGATANQTDAYLLDLGNHTGNLDGRYFTESEVTTLLAGKQNSLSGTGYIKIEGSTINYVNETYSLSTHNHDAAYSAIGHNHDATYAPISHNHNDLYYTEAEVDGLLAGKQAAGSYANATHNHVASDINSGTLDEARIPTIPQSKVTDLGTDMDALEAAILGKQPLIQNYAYGYWIPQVGTTTINTLLMRDLQQFNNTTAFAAGTIANTNLFTSLPRLNMITSTTASSYAHTRTQNVSMLWRGNATGLGGFIYSGTAGNASAATVANQNIFWGLMNNNNGQNVATDPSTTFVNCIGIAKDAADVNYQIIHNDGSGTCTKIDLGSDYPATTLSTDVYRLTIECEPNGSGYTYKVERLNVPSQPAATGTITTNIPTSGTFLTNHVWTSNGGTALAATLAVFKQYVLIKNPM